MSELKPCPFCGSKKNLAYCTNNHYHNEQSIECSFCEAEVHENTWRERPIEDAVTMERDKLKAERDEAREAFMALWNIGFREGRTTQPSPEWTLARRFYNKLTEEAK